MRLGSRFFRGGLVGTEERIPLLQGFQLSISPVSARHVSSSRTAKRVQYNVIGVWKETASGGKDSQPERKQVMAMAQARRIDVIVVSELTRW
jgi:hypothetical protein